MGFFEFNFLPVGEHKRSQNANEIRLFNLAYLILQPFDKKPTRFSLFPCHAMQHTQHSVAGAVACVTRAGVKVFLIFQPLRRTCNFVAFQRLGPLNLPPIFQFSVCVCVCMSLSLKQLEAKLKLQLFDLHVDDVAALRVPPKKRQKKKGKKKKEENKRKQAKGCLIKLAQVRFVKMPKICLRKFPTSGTNEVEML